MDFDIGTFIYILLTLVFIIIGSLGKKKKPQANKPNVNADGEADSGITTEVFSDNFKKLFGDFEEEMGISETRGEPVIEEQEVKLDTPNDKIDNLEGILDVPGNTVGDSKIYKMEDHIKDIMDDSNIVMAESSKSKSTFVSRALRDFDPQKAWLYSEIFKPKYF
jgi:hypothetical protein